MEELFKLKGLKITRQRKIVFQLINSLGDSATIKNIYNKCKSFMDYSTVYRIIELFVKLDIIDKKLNYDNDIYYCIKEEHGHYINCVKCHRKEKIYDCPIDDMEKRLESNGYKILNHIVQIDGICLDCQKK